MKRNLLIGILFLIGMTSCRVIVIPDSQVLKEKYPSHHFSVIMGGDSFQNISQWKNYQILIRDYDLYVYGRPGFEVRIPSEYKNVYLVKAPFLEISATQIRANVKKGKSIRFLVPERVREEIEKNGYYRN